MGNDEAEGAKTKKWRNEKGQAKNVKSVHKYRGPEHITTVTRPLILTPAVLVTMDTLQLGPPTPSAHRPHPLAFH